MSVQSEIARIEQAKSDIFTSISNYGLEVASDATLDDAPSLIDSIGTTMTAEIEALREDVDTLRADVDAIQSITTEELDTMLV